MLNEYDELSSRYHLIFDNWEHDAQADGDSIAKLLPSPNICGPILDCSCGIGTQLIALKKFNYDITGADISPEQVKRARKEAAKLTLNIDIHVDDMRTLLTFPLNTYSVIFSLGNSLPHLLSEDDILKAFIAMKKRLTANGMILIGIRDYEPILLNKTTVLQPLFLNDQYGKRIVHQIWEWQDNRIFIVHLYITQAVAQNWNVTHDTFTYRAITLNEVINLMKKAGFSNISILDPSITQFCQPIIKGFN